MSFMAQHYNCCADSGCGDATMDKQDTILADIAQLAADIAAISTGGGTATSTKQDEILDEIKTLSGGLHTF